MELPGAGRYYDARSFNPVCQNTMQTVDPIVYLNGTYVPKSQASMSVEDRGTLFGDGVYEVLRCYDGTPLALEEHLGRLIESLKKISLPAPDELGKLPQVVDELLERNNLKDARVYYQVTRGAAPRNPKFPVGVEPTILGIASPCPGVDVGDPVPAHTAMLTEDERWANCWIKSVMLLPNILAANKAMQAGYDIAIMHRGDTVTEATNANVMVIRDGELWTHPADRWILNGVTRRLVLDLAEKVGVAVREEACTVDQLKQADEVLITGTTVHVTAITHINGNPVGDGKPGKVTEKLHHAICRFIQANCLS